MLSYFWKFKLAYYLKKLFLLNTVTCFVKLLVYYEPKHSDFNVVLTFFVSVLNKVWFQNLNSRTLFYRQILLNTAFDLKTLILFWLFISFLHPVISRYWELVPASSSPEVNEKFIPPINGPWCFKKCFKKMYLFLLFSQIRRMINKSDTKNQSDLGLINILDF